MYHFAQWPSSSCGCTSTCTHVPEGVFAFHEATSSLKPKPRPVTPDVQVPESYEPEPSAPSPE